MKNLRWMICCLFIWNSIICEGNDSYSYCEPFFDNMCYDEYSGGSWTVRLEGGYTFGKFIGLEKKYGEIGLFLASPVIDEWQPFLDARGYRLEGGKWAASTGVGVRVWDAYLERLWGANLYYDYRNVCFGALNRMGLGFESLGECWDVRINTYIPIKSKTTSKLKVFDPFDDTLFGICHFREFQFYGLDAEVGGTLWSWFDDLTLYGAIGPYYYYNRCPGHIFGGYARLELNYFKYVTFEALVSHDKKYGTQGQGKAMINIPFEELFACLGWIACCPDSCKALFVQPVKRNNVIFTSKDCELKWQW